MHINVIVVLPMTFLTEPKVRWYLRASKTLESLIDCGDILSDGSYLGWNWLDRQDPIVVEDEYQKASGFLSDTTPFVHKIVTPEGEVKDVPLPHKGWSTWGGESVDPRVDYHGYPYMVFDLHV
jgi:hypothetical protein